VSPLNKILSEALRLSVKERAVIAQRLLSSLEVSSHEKNLAVEKAWQKEIQKRWADIRKGRVDLVSWEQVELEMKKRSRAA